MNTLFLFIANSIEESKKINKINLCSESRLQLLFVVTLTATYHQCLFMHHDFLLNKENRRQISHVKLLLLPMCVFVTSKGNRLSLKQ